MPDILISKAAVFANGTWLNPGYVVVENGRILKAAVGNPPDELAGQCKEVIEAEHCAVLPGLTNGHTHFSQVFMRGLAGGRSLLPWLKEVIWPLQAAITSEEMHLAALLGLIENLKCGAIWVTDHHKITPTTAHTDAVCKAAELVGLRFTLSRSWSDRGSNPEEPDAILADLARLFEHWKGHPYVQVSNGPLALWRCTADTLRKSHSLALEYNSITHFHVSESSDEAKMSVDEYGLRPVEWLKNIEVLDSHTQLVHAVWLENNEIDLLAESGAMVIHCPVSNAVLGSGPAPIKQMIENSIPLLLGTDGPASNDTQDIWETLKSAVFLARIISLDATVLPPIQALSLALGGRTLEKNGAADLIIVDLSHPRVTPVQDVTSALVLGTHGSDVKTVIVGGKILMRDRQVLILDEAALLNECRVAINHLRKRAGLT